MRSSANVGSALLEVQVAVGFTGKGVAKRFSQVPQLAAWDMPVAIVRIGGQAEAVEVQQILGRMPLAIGLAERVANP